MTVERLRELLAEFQPFDEVQVVVDPTGDSQSAGEYIVDRVKVCGTGARCRLIVEPNW